MRLLVTSSAMLAASGSAAANAQSVSAEADSLRLTPAWDVERHVPRDVTLNFRLNRALRVEDGRLAIIVGRTDVSPLVEVTGTDVRLPLRGQRLAAGDLEVIGYLVSAAGEWSELGRFALRRLTRTGFESAAVTPKLDLQSDGQLRAGLPPGAPPLPRGELYQDLTLNGGWDVNMRRAGREIAAQGLLVGASRDEARLRAAQIGSSAPAIDLASYGIRLARQNVSLTAGHIGLGSHRHLLSQFRSRGVTGDLQIGQRLKASLSGVAGSEIVGWDDPLGLRRPGHRILSGAVGIEAVPSRPGLLRVELTTLKGSLQPIPSFNQGAVTDRQESSGVGAQLAAADPSQRVRLTLGVARSRFTNPTDPALARDAALVPVRPETRSARFGELSWEALRGAKIGRTTTNLAIAARHERIDPQYRTVAVPLQADRQQNTVDATGSIGPLQLQLSATRAHDNLARIPSLLTTRTNGQSVGAALPVATLVGAAPTAWWWPSLTLAWQGVTQIGDAIPVDGGFRAEFQVPNQRTTNLTLGSGWQRGAWNVAWRYNHSLVDNRQPERERSDFATDAYAATVGVTPSARLNLTIDLASERLRSIELDQSARNRRSSFQASWQPFGFSALNGVYSLTWSDEPAASRRGSNSEFRVEASQGFNVYARRTDGAQARAFIRYARTGSALRFDSVLQPAQNQWNLNGGLSLRVF